MSGAAPTRTQPQAPVRVNGARLNRAPERCYVIGLMCDAKLDVTVDAAGITIGRRAAALHSNGGVDVSS